MFSKEYLFKKCVIERHCLLLRLYNDIVWDNKTVDEIFMLGMCLKEDDVKQVLLNITFTVNTFGKIEIIAFAGNDKPYDARVVTISTDDINEIELI